MLLYRRLTALSTSTTIRHKEWAPESTEERVLQALPVNRARIKAGLGGTCLRLPAGQAARGAVELSRGAPVCRASSEARAPCSYATMFPLIEGTLVDVLASGCCKGFIRRAEPDDDLNYTLLALILLERDGAAFAHFQTSPGYRLRCFQRLPGTGRSEQPIARTSCTVDDEFVNGEAPGFDPR